MSALVNTIGITLGLGVMGLGGWGMIVLINKEPKSYTLGSDDAKSIPSNYSSGTLGEKNKDKLVADIEKNEDWFNWAYKNLLVPKKHAESTNITDEFKKVEKGYIKESGDSEKALNKVCDTYYKKNKDNLSSDSDKIKNSVSWFCTAEGNKSIEIPS